ncbi:MAG TPA: serpin family protein [Firmicutes bacterium]|jgi:serpin B|nr:serpin family protein [Bacillota bacterium]
MKATAGIVRLVLGLAVIFALVSTSASSSSVSAGDVKALVSGNNAFAFDLYSVVSSRDGNLFISPYSISSALAMTYAGARGNTAAQMADALHYDLAPEQLHESFSALSRLFNSGGKTYRLSVANALWSQMGLSFLPEYISMAEKHYDAGLKEVDFVYRTEEARSAINRWVEDKTEGKIIDLIGPGVLDPLTRLVLTNAIYFKGQWEQQFRPEQTEEAAFYLSSGKQAIVPFMHQIGTFKYAETGSTQVLELPYSGNELAMTVLLPKPDSSLAELEAAIRTDGIEAILETLSPTRVDVSIPRFKFEAELSLSGYLQQLGMIDAFDDNIADFSGISDTFLYITHVLHKAFIEVNEEGTEAAAATAVVVGTKSIRLDLPKVFMADRPFVFLIRDVRTGSILFMGRMADPLSQ